MFFEAGLANTVSAINGAYKHHLDFIVLPTNRYILTILDRLVEFNCIKYYVFLRKDYKKIIKIYLNYIDGIPAVTSFKLIDKSSKHYSISTRALKTVYFNCRGVLCLLNTSHGILTIQEAISLRCGGFLLLSVYY